MDKHSSVNTFSVLVDFVDMGFKLMSTCAFAEI